MPSGEAPSIQVYTGVLELPSASSTTKLCMNDEIAIAAGMSPDIECSSRRNACFTLPADSGGSQGTSSYAEFSSRSLNLAADNPPEETSKQSTSRDDFNVIALRWRGRQTCFSSRQESGSRRNPERAS